MYHDVVVMTSAPHDQGPVAEPSSLLAEDSFAGVVLENIYGQDDSPHVELLEDRGELHRILLLWRGRRGQSSTGDGVRPAKELFC